MSDSRRRRKAHHSGDSDDLSDSYDELNVTKETQSSEPTEDHHDSEYDTAGSDSETESQEGVLRESGDGQEEEKPQKKLDDDEDRRNPQYIPKRGTFYEHDDRTAEEVTGGEKAVEPQVERESKEKKVWKDKEDKWNHDRYNDDEQAPKSHEELIAVYGYDIRNEEGPPRARRRRRYGRGPNKYTRNWEDEDAYGKVAGSTPNKSTGRKSNRSGEEFPALGDSNKDSPKPEEPVISSAWYSNKAKMSNKANFPPLQLQQDGYKSKQSNTPSSQLNENKSSNETINQSWKRETKSTSYFQSSNGNSGGGDADKSVNVKALSRDSNKRNVQESASLAASRVRGRGFKANTNNNIVGNRGLDSKPKGRGPGPINPDNRRINAVYPDDEHQLANDVKHMNIAESSSYHPSGRQNKHFHTQSTNQQRSTPMPQRLQQSHPQQQPPPHQQQQVHQQPPATAQDGTGNRPKRYSSLRQRPPITEGPGQPNYQAPHAQHTYYQPQAGSSRAVLEPQGYPQGPFEQTPPVAPPTAPMTGQPVIPLPAAPQPPSYAPPPPFLVPPPQFMPPQTAPPSIINYVPGPNGPTFQPNYQSYQGYTPAPVPPQGPPPPQELFQPQGCTYYSPAQQQQQQQPVRRPKAAIPILPPPDNQQQYQSPRGRGKNSPQQQHHQHHEFQQHYQQQALQEQQQEYMQQQHQQVLLQQQQQELQTQHQLELKQLKLQQELEQRQQEMQHQQEVKEQEKLQSHLEVQPHLQDVQPLQQELVQQQQQQEIIHQQEIQQHQQEIEEHQEILQSHHQETQPNEQNLYQSQTKVEHLETQKLQPEVQKTYEELQQHVQEISNEINQQHLEVEQEQKVQEPQKELQQQEVNSSDSLSSQKIQVEDKLQAIDVSLYPSAEKYEIPQTEQAENVNIQRKDIEIVPEILAKVEEKSVETIFKSIDSSEVIDSVSEAPVKCNAPVVDEIVTPSGETIVNKGEAENAVIESPIVEEAAA